MERMQFEKKENVEELVGEIDAILDAIHDDVLITDGKGFVIKVSPTFEDVYGISKEDAIGMSVFEMEKRSIFKPSVTSVVLKTGKKVTMRQKNNKDRDIVVTATPVKNEKGEITKVISFSRDITELLNLQEQYAKLEDKMERYEEELEALRSKEAGVDGIITKSESSKKIIKTLCRIAKFDANVLLTGESGVGKSMYAKMVHQKSLRASGPFIEINCGAIPENLLESELFGYEKGSFTGASKNGKIGLIELAQNGTLFLDEIGEMPIGLQVKILKVIQDKTITRVGGTKEIKVDFRLIAASNKNFKELIDKNRFREDLYYRLNVITIEIPPIRQRKEDIVPLIVYFLEKFNTFYGLSRSLSEKAFERLVNYNWPGNIRELENAVERVVLTSETNLITSDKLQLGTLRGPKFYSGDDESLDLNGLLEELEELLVQDAYGKCRTTIGVAKMLKISQPTAVRKIKKYVKE